MTNANLPRPAGKQSGLNKILTLSARVLFAFCVFQSVTAISTAQSRTDNRRLFWTGTEGMVWDNSAASWMTTGSFLAYANSSTGSQVWLSALPGSGDPVVAIPEATFIAGDTVIFDSRSDLPPDALSADMMGTRNITIADEGVTASDVIISGFGSFVFTGGGITADAGSVVAGSVQLLGTGTGLAATAVAPGGRLFIRRAGSVTLSNTIANKFEGGIYINNTTLILTNTIALGNNDIFIPLVAPDTVGSGTMQFLASPAIVLDASGSMLLSGSTKNTSTNGNSNWYPAETIIRVTPDAAGLDITGNITINAAPLTLDIQGDTTISGNIYGALGSYGATNGRIIKEGDGTLILSGTQNWFYAASGSASEINAGRVVATNQYAIGSGPISITPNAVLEFRNVHGILRQSFVGGGNIEITQGSDLTFNWRDGVLHDYESLPGAAPARSDIGVLTVTGTSRFSAIASGTYATVLGGATVQIFVDDHSTLALGREGLSSRGTGTTDYPVNYPIYANRVSLANGSALVLNADAFLRTGVLDLSADSYISFGASGISHIHYEDGTNPAALTYVLPKGMELVINEIAAPVGYHREYMVVNKGGSPLNDIALTVGTISKAHDAVSARISDDFLDPLTRLAPSRGRKWVNNVWMRYMTSNFDYDAESITTPGVDGKIDGAVAGFNGILPGRILLGIYAGMADNRLDTTNDSSIDSKQRFVGINTAQTFGKFYISLDVNTGRVRSDFIRREPANTLRGKWETSYYSGAIQVGALFSPWNKGMVKPYAGLRYSRIKLSNYYERSASPLVIDNFDDTNAQSVYGVAVSQKFVVFKRDVSGEISVGRKQIIRAPRSTVNAYFLNAIPDAEGKRPLIKLTRGDYYSDMTTIGLSARLALTSHTQLGVAGDYETSSSYTNTTVSGMVRYSW